MRFWDASATVPVLLDEPAQPTLVELLKRDPGMIVWGGSVVECSSAIARRGAKPR